MRNEHNYFSHFSVYRRESSISGPNQCSYTCWVFSSSTVSTSSFIWFLSSSSSLPASSCSSRDRPLRTAPSGCGAAAAATAAELGLASAAAVAGLWSDGDVDKVFREGCRGEGGERCSCMSERPQLLVPPPPGVPVKGLT